MYSRKKVLKLFGVITERVRLLRESLERRVYESGLISVYSQNLDRRIREIEMFKGYFSETIMEQPLLDGRFIDQVMGFSPCVFIYDFDLFPRIIYIINVERGGLPGCKKNDCKFKIKVLAYIFYLVVGFGVVDFVGIPTKYVCEELRENYDFKIPKTFVRIITLNAKIIALRLPESLLLVACVRSDIFSRLADERKDPIDILIKGDGAYKDCCIGDFTTRKLNGDFFIHYGHSCMAPDCCTKTLYETIDIKFDINCSLNTILKGVEINR